jgi:hypothetical protein
MKVVINECYGGFGLSSKAMSRIAELQGRECYTFDLKTEPTSDGYKSSYVPVDPNSERAYYYFDIPNPNEVIKNDKTWSKHQYDLHSIENFDKDRSNPLLIRVVEELGEEANGDCAELKIVEIPDGTDFIIQEYDGIEWVAEKHRTWR